MFVIAKQCKLIKFSAELLSRRQHRQNPNINVANKVFASSPAAFLLGVADDPKKSSTDTRRVPMLPVKVH